MLANPCELNHEPKLATELLKIIFYLQTFAAYSWSSPQHPWLNLTLDMAAKQSLQL